MKVVSLDFKINGIQTELKSLNEISKALTDLKKNSGDINIGGNTTNVDKLNVKIKELETALKSAKSNANFDFSNVNSGDLDKPVKNLAELEALLKRIKAESKNLDFGSDELQRFQQAQARLTAQQKELRAEQRKQANEVTATSNTYRGLSARLNLLRNQYKDLVVQERATTNEGKKLRSEITQLDSRLKSIDASVGQYQRNVGNYASAFGNLGKSIASAFGVTSGVILFTNALRSAGNIILNFDQGVADLASITGKTVEEISDLTDQAKELGATTAFSATEVLKLQTELAKLGFTSTEILASTKAIEDFSIAVGADAGEAAALGGAALRAFGLEAQEIERVVSTLAVATTKSALDFSFLNTALSTVAPVAKSFGFTIEETTALLGTLANAGFDASTAATSTRNILLNLADGNGKLAKSLGGPISSLDELVPALNQLRDSGVDLNEALELTDKRSVAAFSNFLENADSANALKESITGVNEELSVMVEQRLDTLDGSLKLTKSAWEGFVLSIEDGDGIISKAIRGTLSSFQGLFQVLTELNNEDTDFFRRISLGGGGIDKTNEQVDKLKNALRSAVDQGASLADLFDAGIFTDLEEGLFQSGFTKESAKEQTEAFFDELVEQSFQQKKSTEDVIGSISDPLIKSQEELKKSAKETTKALKDQAAEGSIAFLKSQVSEIEKTINSSNLNENQLRDKLQEIADIKEDIREAEDLVKSLRRAVDTSDLDKIALDIESGNFDDEIISDQFTGGIDIEGELKKAEEAAARRIELNEAAEATDLKNAQEAIAKRAEAEANAIAEKERLEQEASDKRLEREQFIQDQISTLISSTSAKVFEIQKAQLTQRTDAELEALDTEFNRRIEAAEGDVQLQRALQAELAQEKEKIDKKSAEERKKIAIKEAIIQTALAVVEALPDPFRVAFAALTGAIQLAAIRSQSFFDGGFTGKSKAKKDRSGGRPTHDIIENSGTQIVHKRYHQNEYVTPEHVLNRPEAQPHIAALEAMRKKKKGYANKGRRASSSFMEGGFTGAAPSFKVAGVSRAEISEDSINLIAERIGAKVEDGSTNGTKAGIRSAQEQSTLLSQLENDTNIR